MQRREATVVCLALWAVPSNVAGALSATVDSGRPPMRGRSRDGSHGYRPPPRLIQDGASGVGSTAVVSGAFGVVNQLAAAALTAVTS